jgi:pilus assembly protein Flp/PilA
MLKLIKLLKRDERGVTALEYAILAGVIVAAVVGVGASFGTNLQTVFRNLTTKVTNTISSSS